MNLYCVSSLESKVNKNNLSIALVILRNMWITHWRMQEHLAPPVNYPCIELYWNWGTLFGCNFSVFMGMLYLIRQV